MEIRHHMLLSIQALLERVKEELKVMDHIEMIERLYKYMKAQNYFSDTIYTHLNRALLFLKYVRP